MIEELKNDLKCSGYLIAPYTGNINQLKPKEVIIQEENNSIKVYVRDEEYNLVFDYLFARGHNPSREKHEILTVETGQKQLLDKYIRVAF